MTATSKHVVVAKRTASRFGQLLEPLKPSLSGFVASELVDPTGPAVRLVRGSGKTFCSLSLLALLLLLQLLEYGVNFLVFLLWLLLLHLFRSRLV